MTPQSNLNQALHIVSSVEEMGWTEMIHLQEAELSISPTDDMSRWVFNTNISIVHIPTTIYKHKGTS